ncbi:MAG TPA: hypothetical protein VFQ30_18115 [Ktedonobacteraceae bacterium]|nr:hypothetical protein [Ktedonobacteraceae bacterium]
MSVSVPDNFIPIIPVEDDPIHTEHSPFCLDSTCDCHEDLALIQEVQQHVTDGLMTPEEATDFVLGKLL